MAKCDSLLHWRVLIGQRVWSTLGNSYIHGAHFGWPDYICHWSHDQYLLGNDARPVHFWVCFLSVSHFVVTATDFNLLNSIIFTALAQNRWLLHRIVTLSCGSKERS